MNNLLRYLTYEEYICNEKDLNIKSLFLIKVLYKDKLDKNNIPYVLHLIMSSKKYYNYYKF